VKLAAASALAALVIEVLGYFQLRADSPDVASKMLVVIAVSAVGAIWLCFCVIWRGRSD
jgi:hypothetical protein